MTSIEQILQLALAFVFGGGASAVVAKRMLKDVAATGAETQVINLLRAEVTRLSESNKLLDENIQRLAAENAELRAELIALRVVIQKLGINRDIDLQEISHGA